MSPLHYLPKNTRVRFELLGALPIFRERYVSPQAGTVVLQGFFNQTAHLELQDGTRYRTLSPKRDEKHLDQLAYRVIRWADRTDVCRLLTPIRLGKGTTPRLRYTTILDNQRYVFRPVGIAQQRFELWNGLETQKLVQRESSRTLVADLTVLCPVPTLLVLLFPWLDHQHVTSRQS